MLRDYENISPEQEKAETVVFDQWFDWFFEQQGIPQDTEFDLDCGKKSVKDLKDMFVNSFELQEAALTYLPGVAVASDRETFLKFLQGSMNSFVKMGFL